MLGKTFKGTLSFLKHVRLKFGPTTAKDDKSRQETERETDREQG